MAAYYPDSPSEEDKSNISLFLDTFMEVGIDYEDWGKNFLKKMREENPVDLSSRQNFSVWMCKQHNLFNKEKGKNMYDCEYQNLKKRWGPM
ncbi:erv1 alr family protein [Stylonychia lemnae]|uniref:Sulfhydryl oxidase n=1 Tax=Stylonychia lemnae TaxID=5949 RepID=A0A078AZM8_STYLE|nr:erv1 alr family protein [Stylonychia lemnae]|eukprot:CDW86657.1 erv1 alr family protein [Stylonychia lemnae]